MKALSELNSTTVVVAAGGRARRLGSAQPKSLLNFGDRTYLQIALDSLSSWNFARLVIATDRIDHMESYRSIAVNASIVSPVNIAIDGGVASTLELAREAAVEADGTHILFLYGHAPRLPLHLAALFRHAVSCHARSIVVSTYSGSTKRCPVSWTADRFVEPPYLIDRALLAGTSASTWDAFFSAHRNEISAVDLEGPGEFNYTADVPRYERYLSYWSVPALRANLQLVAY